MTVTYLLAFILSVIFCGLSSRFLALLNCVDVPNERSSHERPVVRGGGLGILIGMFAASLFAGELRELLLFWILAFGAGLVAVVSFLDDRQEVAARWRFGCHLTASILAVLGIWVFEGGLEWGPWAWVAMPVALVWIAGYINAFNFMDGINGLAGGQACLSAAGSVAVIGLVTGQWNDAPLIVYGILAMASAGFLPYNFPHARMFMGDVGSATLGFLLAALAWWSALRYGWEVGLLLALLQANFVLDTGITLIIRIFGGEKWYEAHRKHFYQKLLRSGMSHVGVTLLEWAGVVLVGTLAVWYGGDGLQGLMLVTGAVVLIWGSFFFWSHRRFIQSGAMRTS